MTWILSSLIRFLTFFYDKGAFSHEYLFSGDNYPSGEGPAGLKSQQGADKTLVSDP